MPICNFFVCFLLLQSVAFSNENGSCYPLILKLFKVPTTRLHYSFTNDFKNKFDPQLIYYFQEELELIASDLSIADVKKLQKSLNHIRYNNLKLRRLFPKNIIIVDQELKERWIILAHIVHEASHAADWIPDSRNFLRTIKKFTQSFSRESEANSLKHEYNFLRSLYDLLKSDKKIRKKFFDSYAVPDQDQKMIWSILNQKEGSLAVDFKYDDNPLFDIYFDNLFLDYFSIRDVASQPLEIFVARNNLSTIDYYKNLNAYWRERDLFVIAIFTWFIFKASESAYDLIKKPQKNF